MYVFSGQYSIDLTGGASLLLVEESNNNNNCWPTRQSHGSSTPFRDTVGSLHLNAVTSVTGLKEKSVDPLGRGHKFMASFFDHRRERGPHTQFLLHGAIEQRASMGNNALQI